MSNTVRIDPRAFSRGVDEVLKLKPVRRAMNSFITQMVKPSTNRDGANSNPVPIHLRTTGSDDKTPK